MKRFLSILSSLTVYPLLAFATIPETEVPGTLNITALTGENGQSALECWQLERRFDVSDDPGTKGTAVLPLDGLRGEAKYSVLPPNFNGGLHNAPVAQWVIYVSGVAHITLPNRTEETWIRGGANGAIIAADTADASERGHFTVYPSNIQTIAWQLPFKDGALPKHRVLHRGACKRDESWS
ncbi:hypothetical protein H112_05247 [Trichophyton rubrum D6]|uniref:Cupin type-1 domain-containing protein n=3 Tax=Trichophyton TaxID=5550 RepID=F2SM39_TRIRC|nr:uncharacterized protein TERG_02999 [Trichophyton rubrum CBS 118892]EZF20212.1 hypothetical protein H100_05269 [Trichophyton rubrum MR850]EZF40776.1 hypothetical protein H102_05259 [Trichophyton rubrum CBS 100081]EZF51393.1 hypothetical protein H103_05260 [Trichophyton rubrum CBS 288.86]EZF62074.1 hypothetical protein H104_05250 [Trichophyton rubrum CBS 289.86]EZF72667.1 hypothetical protein H105_05278 [Trichophyton soudanense CBS 452.61]EZF83447.1 hypothetical protein H110_05257 [Trichophy